MAIVVSDFDREHIDEIMRGEGDSYSRQLLRLCAKADGAELMTLAEVYPDHVAVYLAWCHGVKPAPRPLASLSPPTSKPSAPRIGRQE